MADNSSPASNEDPAVLEEKFLSIFDAIVRKEDCSDRNEQDLVAKLSQRITQLKTMLTKEYEIQKEALI